MRGGIDAMERWCFGREAGGGNGVRLGRAGFSQAVWHA